MKQLWRVYQAVRGGAVTSLECAEVTGLSVKRCSSHLAYLRGLGLIRKTGSVTKPDGRGPVAYWHEVVA